MWRSRHTGAADQADHLPLLDPLTTFNHTLGKMQVFGHDIVSMLDEHIIAVEFVVSRVDHFTITSRIHRCAGGGPVVDTIVRFYTLEYRVKTFRVEVGADVGKVKRRAQKCFAHVAAIRCEVLSLSINIKADGFKLFPLVHKTSCNDLTVA